MSYLEELLPEFRKGAKIVGILCKINDDGEHKFVRNFEDAKIAYKHCRHIHTDAGFGYAECEDCYYSYLRGGSEGK